MRARERILETVEILVQKFKQENPPGSEGRAQTSMMGRVCYCTDEQGKAMNPETLNDNVLNMIFAGHDNTYASMGTALHYLSQYPDVLDALTKEVQSFQDPLSFDELKNAPILNAFLAESWRMDPPVAGAFRELKKDTEYKGYKLSKDMVIRYNILAASQNDDLYPSPLTFEIQRYLPKDHPLVVDSSLEAQGVDYNNLKANYPIFGGGAHGCLGSHFAKLEMRVLLTRLLQNFKLEVRNSEKVHFPVNGWKNEFRLTKK
jgi:cytochrome P450